MKKKSKILIFALIFIILLIVSILVFSTGARRRWKNQAIIEISNFANDRKRVAEQISKQNLKQNSKDELSWWLSDKLIILKNGDWLAYKSHCSKRAPYNVSDIFIAKASNGKWYYSTYHFCIGMLTLMQEEDFESPKDLNYFIKKYCLKEFDGKSDECLKKTWP